MRTLSMLLMVFALVGCAATLPPAGGELRELSRLLVGDYFSAADGGVREGRPIYLRIRPIDSPLPHTFALFAEMRHDGPDGELYRQRAYVFDTGSSAPLAMQALVFDDPVAASGLRDDPTLWVRQQLGARNTLGEGCDTHWVRQDGGFLGRVDPATCVITGKRGDRRRIESQTLITPGYIGQLERGYDLDGKLLFGNPDGTLYRWPRVR